jgi:hypothetical protein
MSIDQLFQSNNYQLFANSVNTNTLYSPNTISFARFYNSANVSIANATDTIMTWGHVLFPTNVTPFTESAGTLTCTAIKVLVTLSVQIPWGVSATGERNVWFVINNTGTNQKHSLVKLPGTLAINSASVSFIITFGQQFSVRLSQNSGGALDVIGQTASPDLFSELLITCVSL